MRAGTPRRLRLGRSHHADLIEDSPKATVLLEGLGQPAVGTCPKMLNNAGKISRFWHLDVPLKKSRSNEMSQRRSAGVQLSHRPAARLMEPANIDIITTTRDLPEQKLKPGRRSRWGQPAPVVASPYAKTPPSVASLSVVWKPRNARMGRPAVTKSPCVRLSLSIRVTRSRGEALRQVIGP